MFKKLFLSSLVSCALCADNQTQIISQIYPETTLPYSIELKEADFVLPVGIHSFASTVYGNEWLIIGGRINGLHGFDPDNDNFPPDQQNSAIYVVDYHKKKTWFRQLDTSQEVIDSLSVTNPQYYQKGDTFYIAGGYGVITSTGQFSTKDTLTAVDIPGIIRWVKYETTHSVDKYLRQIHNSAFQVTGGEMSQIGDNPTLLVFGQNFAGYYYEGSNGDYTRQVRRFLIHDDGRELSAEILDPIPAVPDPSYRRRDLNVVPIMEGDEKRAFMAYSGVFTPNGAGIWTVPVRIEADGKTQMENPNAYNSLKQGMNNYICPTLGLFSKEHRDMYTLFFGGLTYGFFEDNYFKTDSEVPFTNQITTIKRDARGIHSQYLMNAEYPVMISTQSNPGNQLLFGTGAMFFPKLEVPMYENWVLQLDELPKGKSHVGYIVGGIQSTVPNTFADSDTAASPYIFKVYINKK